MRRPSWLAGPPHPEGDACVAPTACLWAGLIVCAKMNQRVPISVAVAPSAWLAKTAAEAHKPAAAVVSRPADLPTVYAGLELEDLPGAGPRICARLRAAGITSPRALHDAGRSHAIAAWGSIDGERVRLALRGADVPAPGRVRRSVAHGRVLGREGCWRGSRPVVRWLVVCGLRRCAEAGQPPPRQVHSSVSVFRPAASCSSLRRTCDSAAETNPAGTATIPNPHINTTKVNALPPTVRGYTSP